MRHKKTNGKGSLLLHFAVFDGLAVEDLREPIEDWMQDEGANLRRRSVRTVPCSVDRSG